MTERPPRNFWTRMEQLALAALLMCAMIALGGYWISRGAIQGRLIEIEDSAPLSARFQVDVNEAQWPELAQLPGIGETMARRIIEERSARGNFADHEDLRRREQGVGPRTLERIRPYLSPMPDVRNVAGGEARSGTSGG